jgi:hypothetical protein
LNTIHLKARLPNTSHGRARGFLSYTNKNKTTLERLSRVTASTYSRVILPHDEATPNYSTCRFAPPVRKYCLLEIHKANRPLTNGRFLRAIPRALIRIKQTPHFTLESSNTPSPSFPHVCLLAPMIRFGNPSPGDSLRILQIRERAQYSIPFYSLRLSAGELVSRNLLRGGGTIRGLQIWHPESFRVGHLRRVFKFLFGQGLCKAWF